MNRRLHTILGLAGWFLMLAYIVFAARQCSSLHGQTNASGLEITVNNPKKSDVISEETIREWIMESEIPIADRGIAEVETERLEEFLGQNPFIKKARVYTDISGTVHVDVWQRRPLARVHTSSGHDFYVSEDNYVLPVRTDNTMYVPVITGDLPLPFAPGWFGAVDSFDCEQEKKVYEKYLYLSKLINFVRIIGQNSFWSAQVVQINIEKPARVGGADSFTEPDLEIIPRVGRHVVKLGGLDDIPRKLDKLLLFYRGVLQYEGWDSYRYIDLSYRNQVICTN